MKKFAALILITFGIFLTGQEINKAPSFRLESVTGGHVELDSLLIRGPVLLNFWASWCKSCKDELPDIHRIKEEFEKKGLSVVTVTIDNPSAVRRAVSFLRTRDLNLMLLKDSDMRVFKSYGGTNTVPFTFLIDTERTVRFSKRSHTDYKELFKEISKLIE